MKLPLQAACTNICCNHFSFIFINYETRIFQYTLNVSEIVKTVTDADMQEDSTLEPGDLKRVGKSSLCLTCLHC